jgi:response regulator RpfG family c-di-GMP phosphodiesterase
MYYMSKLVYIIDDVELMRSMMEALLRRQGFDIRTFSKPEHLFMDLIECEEHELPDIIIADYGLDLGWTGVQVFEEVKKIIPSNVKVKLLGVSSTHPEASHEFAVLGVPFIDRNTMDADLLINTVRQLLGLPPHIYTGEDQ